MISESISILDIVNLFFNYSDNDKNICSIIFMENIENYRWKKLWVLKWFHFLKKLYILNEGILSTWYNETEEYHLLVFKVANMRIKFYMET